MAGKSNSWMLALGVVLLLMLMGKKAEAKEVTPPTTPPIPPEPPSMPPLIDRQGRLKFIPRNRPPVGIVIHHTVVTTPKATEAALKAKGLSTNFEVDQKGNVIMYGDPAVGYAQATGAHANAHTIGIDVTHGSKAPWPAVQVEATRKLVQALAAKFGFPLILAPENERHDWYGWQKASPVPTLFRHRNFVVTDCPEDFPMEALLGQGQQNVT